MNNFLKIVVALAAAAGVVLAVMKLLEADKRRADDRRHIAMFKGKAAVPTRKSGRLGTIKAKLTDDIQDFRDGDDEDSYLFEDTAPETEAHDDSAYDDIFAEDESIDEIFDAASEEFAEAAEEREEAIDEQLEEISEDNLSQLLDS